MIRFALRMLSYSFFGYFMYEVVTGILTPERRPAGSGVPEGSDLGEAMNSETGRMNVTGPGRGRIETTQDVFGTAAPHKVGRGVIS